MAQGRKDVLPHPVHVLSKHDARYPKQLLPFDDAPKKLFVSGNLELFDRVTLGVVGARECSDYGREVTRTLVGPVARAGAVIVSGLARGIDAIAHAAALDNGSSTIAVLGCGIDICYPPRNQWLYQRIAQEGLLVSEYEPGTPAFPYNFPHRNRIIAMLSRSLLVVEATDKSGTRHTADVAANYINVLAVPGPIGSPTSSGTNQLLKEGAFVVTCPDDILDSLKMKTAAPKEIALPDVSELALQVWRAVSAEGLHIDDIAARARLPNGDVALALLELELSGRIVQRGNALYARAPIVL